jgi:hypothetical protein
LPDWLRKYYLYQNNIILKKHLMMKKLLLLMAAGCVALGSFAQSAKKPVFVKDERTSRGVPVMIGNSPKVGAPTSANKNTVGGSRWYFPAELAEAYYGDMSREFVYLIGYDSTYLQTFANNVSAPVNYIGFAQFFDLSYSEGFNTSDPNYFTDADIRVTLGNEYTVDSIWFPGAYMIGNKYKSGIDTLILSVAPVAYNDETFGPTVGRPGGTRSWQYEDVESNDSILRVQRLPVMDPKTRGFKTAGAITWKVWLEDTLRKDKTTAGSYPTRGFQFALLDDSTRNPKPLNVPKGSGFAMSVTFKPGYAQVAQHTDSAIDYNYFMYLAREKGDDQISPYARYTYSDRNMSYLMHYASISSGEWGSPIEAELINGTRISQEFIRTGALITCPTCSPLNIKNVNNTFSKVAAYPNPATEQVRVPFILNVNSDVKVTLTNAIGQVVKSQSFKSVTSQVAVFSTSDLANGMYIYTVEANGQRESGRISVSK